MKKIFIALLAIIMVVCCFTLVACNNKAEDIINSYIFEQESLIVDSDFVLPLTIGGEKAKWESNSELVSLEKREEDWLAKVSYPESGIQDVIITLTIGKVSKEYGVRVKAVDEYTFMENYVFLQDRGTVAKDFKLDNQYTYKNKYTCNITWSVDKDYADYLEIENYQDNGVNLQKAIVHKQSEPTPVVIKATFDYKGKQASREYSMNVYQSLEGYELVDYWYSNTGVSIDMSGYVVLIGTEYSSTYNNVTLYMVNDDYTAGYYLYRVKTTNEHAANLKVGAHVTVTGTTNTNYNGLIETNQGGNLVVDTDKHDPYDASKAVKAVDEEVIGDLPATIYNESRLVSLTGWMVKSHCSSSDLSSDNFTLMTITKGNVDVAIRMSKYLEGAYTKGDDTHKALLALLDKYIVGSTINVEGIFSCYKGAWQIMPLSAEKVTSGVVEGDVVIEAPEHKGTADDPYSVEDLEKLQAAQEALENSKNKQYVGQKVAKAVKDVEAKIKDLGLNSRITEKKELELIAESGDVKISYSIREPKSVTVEGTKLTINPSNPETTILQVNYKLGEFETVQLFYIKTLEPSAKSMLDELVVPEQLLKETALPKVEGATIEWTVGELNAEALTIDKENNQFVPHADKELNKAVIVTAKLTYKKSENEIQEASKNFVITVLQEIILEHKGTKEDPYSISDVLKLIKIGDQVTSAFYIKGYVVNVGEWKSSYGNYQDGYMADSALKEGEELEDIDSAYVYILAGIDKGRLCVGDEITASVESLKYYNGVWELYKATATQRKPVAESGEKDNPYAPSEIVKLESHKSLKDKYVSGYIVELGRYSDTYGVYNYARIADSMSSTDKLYVSFIKGNGEGKLNVGDQILGIASSIDYIGEAWELNTINVVERTAVEIKEEVDTNTYVKGIVVELGDWSDANGYAYVLIADAVDGKVKASIANFKGINDGKLVVKDVLVCSFEKIEKDSQLQLTGVKVVTVNGKEQDENYVPDDSGSQGGSGDSGEVNPPAEPEFVNAAEPFDESIGYYLAIDQKTNGNIIYARNEMSGYYVASTTDYKEADMIYIKSVDGGYYLYFKSDDKVTYISAAINGTHNNIILVSENPVIWQYNKDNNYFFTVLKDDDGDRTLYIGTYSNYTTFSLSTIDKISTSFTAHLVYDKATEGSGSQGGSGDSGEVNPDQPTETTVFFTIESIANDEANKWENEKRYESFETDGISFKATGTPVGNHELNTGKYYIKGLNWRIYQNENPSLTITAPEGKKIVSIAIKYSIKNTGVLLNGETQVASEEVVSVNAKSIVFGVGATDPSKTNGQVQVVSVIVVLGEIDGTVIEVPVHTHTYGDLVPAKVPTCGEAGNVAYYHCEECNKYFNEEKEEIESVIIAPTYSHIDDNEDGMCDVCNYQSHKLDGAYINIAIQSKYLTSETYEYTNSKGSKKLEIVVSDKSEDAAIFWVYDNGDGTLSLIATDLETYDRSYLYCNGNDVKYVSLLDMDDNDIYNRFVLEEVEGGYNIKTSAVSYSKVQYLEIYGEYVTCYGLTSDSDVSAFSFTITELNLGGDDDASATPYIYYANDSGDIGIEFDAESKQYIYYLCGSEETRGTASENEDGYYEFYYAMGKGYVQFAIDGDTVSLFDSSIGEDEITLSKSEFNQGSGDGEDEGNDTPVIGDGATFTADQQGTYTANLGPLSDISITIFESIVHFTHANGGYNDDYSAVLSNGQYTITTSYGDTLSFSFSDDGSISGVYNYYYSGYEFTATKAVSTDVAE